jgi:hypothetical protein
MKTLKGTVMKKIFGNVVLLAIIAAMGGCASIDPYAPASSSVERKFDRSYAIGQEQSVSVGAPIVKIKDYYIKKSQLNVVRTEKPFSLFAPPLAHIDIPAGTTANIIGTTTKDGTAYRVAVLPQFPVLSFLLLDDGRFEGSAINRGGSRMGWNYTPNPPDARLIPDTTETVEVSKGYTNFELVYGGATADAIQVLYREYTSDNMARPAFSQQLVYNKESKRFRFRDIQVNVRDADNERIVYTVVSDGM